MKGSKLGVFVIFFTVVFGLSGCAAAGRLDNKHPGNIKNSTYAPGEDKRLVIYTSHGEELYGPVIREFEERTGIWVTVETGGTLELLERIAAEEGENRCDLIFGGGIESLDSYRNRFTPYISEETAAVPSEYLDMDGLWTPFSIPPVVLVYNPKLIRSNPPKGWESLLDPAWKGEIAFANPEASGSGYTALATLLAVWPGEKKETIEKFFRNLDGRVLGNSGQVVTEVANGSFYIGIALEENALRSIKEGHDIALVYPEEGTSAIPDGMAIVSGCRHEENAKRFIDFALSPDVQSYLSASCSLRPVRSDIGQPADIEQDFPLLSYDITLWGSRQEELLSYWHGMVTAGTDGSPSGEVRP